MDRLPNPPHDPSGPTPTPTGAEPPETGTGSRPDLSHLGHLAELLDMIKSGPVHSLFYQVTH